MLIAVTFLPNNHVRNCGTFFVADATSIKLMCLVEFNIIKLMCLVEFNIIIIIFIIIIIINFIFFFGISCVFLPPWIFFIMHRLYAF